MGYYPSKSKQPKNKQPNYKKAISSLNVKTYDTALKHMEINLNEIEGAKYNNRVYDGWYNHIASVGTHNSLMQHSYYINNRVGYQELCMLSTDDMMNNAIQTITRECLNKWGEIKITDSNIDISQQEDLINKINIRFKELNFNNIIYEAIQKSLIYGGVGIYLNFGDDVDISTPLVTKKEFMINNRIKHLKVVEPYLFAPNQLNTINPLAEDFMKPTEWYISGSGAIHTTRFYTMIFFELPNIIKPMYNCLGLSLCQLMKDKVKSAESIRQSLTDLMLRFKTDIIKTPSLLASPELLKDRVDLFNASKNNLGTLVLSDQEEYINSVTGIAGLDKIQAQAFENVASSARLPAVKLLGLTPSGFNATGEFDLKNYYDIIRGYQANTIKPFIDYIINIVCMENGYENIAEFEFSPLEKSNELENAQIKNTQIDAIIKLINSGLLSPEDAFNELQNLGYISKGLDYYTDKDNDNDIKEILAEELI